MAWLEASMGGLHVAISRNPRQFLLIAFVLNPIEIRVPENSQSKWQNLDKRSRISK
jgi:hypothetical protein